MHKPCGYTYEIKRAEYLLDPKENSGKCPICNKHSLNTKDTLNEKFKMRNLGIIATKEPSNKTVEVHNTVCGHDYSVYYLDILNGKNATCPICRSKHRKDIDIDYVKNEIHSIDPNYSVLSDTYTGTHDLLKIEHTTKTGKKHTYFGSRTNFLSGKRCPLCSTSTSKGEQELLSFIKGLGISASKKRFKKDNQMRELDIYIDDKNLGIEFDGLYWHNSNRVGSDYHLEKLNFFYDNFNKARVINIFEDEWDNQKDIVKDKIKSILGLQKDRIYARKCSIKEIPAKERNVFLNKNHIQGSDTANISLGLFYNDELVAVMSFTKLRKALGSTSKEGTYELSRFAGKLGYTIVGGFGKLLKYAISNYDIEKIITYADLRWTSRDNNVYLKNGFALDHISKPSYFYVGLNCDKREFRFKYRKSELKKLFPDLYSDSLSEREIMEKAGYTRIYDCGNLVYTMEIK